VNSFVQVTVCSSVPESGQLWIGHSSGAITVVSFSFRLDRLDFTPTPVRLHAHSDAVSAIVMSRAFSIVVSGGKNGTLLIWDMNR